MLLLCPQIFKEWFMQDFFLIISTVFVYCMTLFMSFHPVQLFYAFLHLGSHSLTFIFGFNVYMFYLLLVLLIAFLFYFLLNKQRSVIHVLLCIVSKNGLILLCCSLCIFSYFQRMTVSLYWLEEIFLLCSILIIQNFLISYTYCYSKKLPYIKQFI